MTKKNNFNADEYLDFLKKFNTKNKMKGDSTK